MSEQLQEKYLGAIDGDNELENLLMQISNRKINFEDGEFEIPEEFAGLLKLNGADPETKAQAILLLNQLMSQDIYGTYEDFQKIYSKLQELVPLDLIQDEDIGRKVNSLALTQAINADEYQVYRVYASTILTFIFGLSMIVFKINEEDITGVSIATILAFNLIYTYFFLRLTIVNPKVRSTININNLLLETQIKQKNKSKFGEPEM